MAGKVLHLEEIISPDRLATTITEQWQTWDSMRELWKLDKEEIRRYVYATDTRHTSNSSLPWKNKTTIPKLCQIRDNLYSNYTATLFPQRKSIIWEANEKDANSKRKREAISNYMSWAIDQSTFKHEIDKIILDYIDFGNAFATVEWIDERTLQADGSTKVGYVGPGLRRINPLDIVMNPIAESFGRSPKIVRSVISMGELKEKLQMLSNDENREEYEELWRYLKEVRTNAMKWTGEWQQHDNLYQMDGFTSFQEYLMSDSVEILTFYGDLYDVDNDKFLKNHVITVVDRHKLIGKKPNPSYFGITPMFHTPWRKKQDNLWGMGPLDNLIGMQYRIDHIENMKADIMDLVTYPVQKIKGYVEDFTWQPGEKIFVSEEGDVELVTPEVNVLQHNVEISNYMEVMELVAGAPREAMGFRTPGEKTKYEVETLQNAAGRIFANKIKQFEEQMLEPLLNAMLELARRNMTGVSTIKVFDDEFKTASFQALTVEDITGIGRIKPVAARHFAEQAQLVQNLSSLAQSPIFQLLAPHTSSVALAKAFDSLFQTEQYEIFMPWVGLAEQAEAQKQAQAYQEQVLQATSTASGMGEDFDVAPMAGAQMAQGQPQ